MEGRGTLVLAVAMMLLQPSPLVSEEPGKLDGSPIDAYKASLALVHRLAFTSEWRDRVAEKSDSFTNSLRQEWKIDFDERRLWRRTQRVPLAEGGRPGGEAISTASEVLVTPNRVYEILVDLDAKQATRSTGYVDVPDDYWATKSGLAYLSFPFGYVRLDDSYEFIPDLLRGCKALEVTRSDEESSPNVLIVGKDDEYEITVAVVPSKGWVAERVVVTFRSAGDTPQVARWSYEVDTFFEHSGVWFPVSYRCEQLSPARQKKLPDSVRMVDGKLVVVAQDSEIGTTVIDKPAMTIFSEVDISDVRLGPLSEDEFQFEATIPDGLRVHMQDARHLGFVWLDRVVVPSAEAMPALMGNERFVDGSGTSRFWLIVGNAVALGILACIFMVRRYTKRRL